MIAAFIMQGRLQAVAVATLFAVASLLLPPVVIVSTAVVGFITLRLGARSGVGVVALATVVIALLGLLAYGNLSMAVVSVVIWLPILFLAMLLRYSGSLSLTVQAALLLGLLPLLIEQLYLASSTGGWQALLSPLQKSLVESKVLSLEESAELVDWLNRWLTSFMAAGFFLQTCLALFLARSWQARLFNPGGFSREFHALRVSRAMSYVAVVVVLLMFAADGDQWSPIRLAAAMLIVLFFLQGLAVLHSLLAKSQAGESWLVGVYVLMLFALPYMAITLAATGFADSWWNFRKVDEGNRPDGPGSTGDDD